MANDLRLQVLLQALDKASTPLARIDAASKGAAKALRDTRDSLRKLDQLQAQVGDFRRLKQGARENEAELEKLQTRIGELSAKIRANDGDVAKHTVDLKRAARAAADLKAKHQQQAEQLQVLRASLAEAGVNTRRLSEAERRLRTDTAAATARLEQQKEALKQQAIHAQRLGAIEKASAANAAARAAAGSQLMGTTAAVAGFGYVLGRVIGAGNEFDYQLQLIGNTANMTATQVASLRDSIMAASRDTGQSASSVEQAIGFLVAAGMDGDTAARSIRAIGRTATASGAEINDIAQASYTLQDALAIRPEGLQRALDMLAQAGKDGNVELRDMAKVLPQFGAAFQAMKMQGPQAVATLGAALEIAKKGAPDADQAATNMANFFQKILSPDTLNKAKAGFGVDLYKIITDAQTKGGNPFEAAMQAIMKMTGGDMKKVGELFQDAQVQHFVLPMMQHWDEYKSIRDDALSAKGVTDRDFAKIALAAKQQFKDLTNAADRVGKALSHSLGGSLGGVAEALVPLLDRLAAFINQHPHLVSAIVLTTGALVGLRLAFLGVRWASTFLGAPAMLARLTAVRGAMAGIAEGGMLAKLRAGASAAFPSLARGASLARAGLLAVTGVSLPVIAAVAGIAAVALLVWKYWEPIKAFFVGIGRGISDVVGPAFAELGQALAPLKPLWDAIAGSLESVWIWIKELFQPFHATGEQLAGATSAGVTFGRVLGYIIGGVVKAITWFVALGQGIGDGVGAIVVYGGKAIDWLSGTWSAVGEAIKAPFVVAFEWISAKLDWFLQKWQALKAALHIGSQQLQPAGMPRNWAFDDGAAPPARFASSAPVRAGSGVVNQQQYHVTVHAAPGHEKAAADTVTAELDRRERAKAARRRSRLSDDD